MIDKNEIKININNGENIIPAEKDSTLLAALTKSNIHVSSACNGRGICGMCRIKVKSFTVEYSFSEEKLLDKNEKEDGIRLSCQIKLKEDIEIILPNILFIPKSRKGKVTSIIDLVHDIKELKIEFLENFKINFNPGQYIKLQVPAYENINTPTQRAYSIASTPNKNFIELFIKLAPNGIVTSYIFNHLKKGDEIEILGPYGDFYLKDSTSDMICVGGNTGIAPIKSMIYHLIEQNKMDRNIWCFFGVRCQKDFFYLNEFLNIEKQFSNFKFIPALSSPLESDDWNGETGLITEVVDRYLKKGISMDKKTEGYLCGSSGMIENTVKVMLENGIPKNKIYFDKYA